MGARHRGLHGDRRRDACAAGQGEADRGGDHLPASGGSQETLHDDVRIHPADPESAERMQLSDDVDRGHGRTGIREVTVRHDIDGPRDMHHWAGPSAVGKVTATRGIQGGVKHGVRRSLPVERFGPERFLTTVRPHQAVGNPLHRVMDVTMEEDGLGNRKDRNSHQ